MSLSSEKSIPLILSHDGKARIRPGGNRGSFNVSTAFAGPPSYDGHQRHHHHSHNEQQQRHHHHSHNEQQQRSSTSEASQFRENNGDDNSVGDNSSVTLTGSLANGFNGSSQRSSIVGNGRIAVNEAASGLSARYYADELRRHLNGRPGISMNSSTSSLLRRKYDHGNLRHLLEKLREDLDRYRNFVDEFVQPPLSGLNLLIDLLRDIQTNRKDYRGSKTANYAHATLEESVCIQCIGKVIMHREHLIRFLDEQEATQTISESCLTEDIDINIAAIEVLSLVCDSPKGHARVIDAVSRSNNRLGQVGRLTGIVVQLISASECDQKATIVRFFNDLWKSAPSLSAKIFLQHELQLAHFRPEDLHQYHSSSTGAETLLEELEIWRRNWIDESSLGRNSNSVEVARNMAALNLELERLKDSLKESNRKLENLESDRRQLDTKCDSYRVKVEDLEDKVRQLRDLYRDRTGMDADEDLRAEAKVESRLGIYGTIERNFTMQARLRNAAMGTIRSDVFVPRATTDPSLMSQSIRLKMASHVQLPLLHWTPMHAVGSTIFEDMDVEAVLRAIDFSDLETTFRIPLKTESLDSMYRKEKSAQRISKEIHFVENNRAKNLIITHRKTGLNPLELKLSIDSCNVSSLPGEFAQLLLNYIPTKEELQQLNVHENSYEDLGEAERILYQMSRVERLNTKLAVMVFLGAYDETISNTKPNMEMLRRASESVIESERLRAVFEIILVYGNYMNCMKRGYAPGFRIDTLAKLSDVKSPDKSVTLLHHLVAIFERNFPALATFYEDLELDDIKTVSYQSIVENILTLRKGVELISEELQYQPNNEAISSFYSTASEEVADLYEPFRDMVNAYRVVCCLFGENHRIIEPTELFGHLIDFIAAFKKASTENYSRLNTPISSMSSDSSKKSGKSVAMTTEAAATAAADMRMSFAEAKNKLRKVSRRSTSGHPLVSDIFEESSAVSDVTSSTDDRQGTSRNVILTSSLRQRDVELKSPTGTVSEVASTGSRSEKDGSRSGINGSRSEENGSRSEKDGSRSEKDGSTSEKDGSTSEKDGSTSEKDGSTSEKGGSRQSAVNVGRSSTSVYYSAVTNANNQRSSNSKKTSMSKKEVPADQRDLPSLPVNHDRSSVVTHANHVQSTGKKSVQSTKTGFHGSSSIYESIAENKPTPKKTTMKTDPSFAVESADSRF